MTVEEVAKRYIGFRENKLKDPIIRDRVLKQNMDDFSLRLCLKKMGEATLAGKAPGAQSSMFKYYATEQNKRRYDLLMSIMGTSALGWDTESGSGEEGFDLQTTRAWLRSKANSIEGGTSEVQLNILAKRVLGLPD